jgi:hypothetical protein
MARLAAGIKGLDDEHAAAAARARVCERLRWIGLADLLGRILLSRRWGEVQDLPHGLDRLGAIAAGEQATMAYAVKALGQDVDEETADEFADVERHRGIAAWSLDPVVLDLEGDPLSVERDQVAVRDGDVTFQSPFPIASTAKDATNASLRGPMFATSSSGRLARDPRGLIDECDLAAGDRLAAMAASDFLPLR